MTEPTLQQIIEATGGKLSRDEQSVIVGYGSLGYYRLIPSQIVRDGQELPAVRVDGKLSKANGSKRDELYASLQASGLEIR